MTDALPAAHVVVGAAIAAVVLRLLAQAVAVKSVGGSGLRLAPGWPLVVVRAQLPRGRELELGVLLAGWMANLGGAGALFSTPKPELHDAGVVFLVVAALALVPIAGSDGNRLLALRRR